MNTVLHKELVANSERNSENLVLTNIQSMGKERFSERQTAVMNAAARLNGVAALPEN
jgi:hypothetical protein